MAETQKASGERRALAELLLYQRSPFGPITTTALIGLVVYGAFLLNIWLVMGDVGAFFNDPGGQIMLRLALILTLILCAALCVNYFDDKASQENADEIASFLGRRAARRREASRPLIYAAIAGLVLGIVFLGLLVYYNADGNFIAFITSTGAWFVPMTPILFVLMARGVAGSLIAGADLGRLIRDDLRVDLYRHHELSLFGRIAMRGAFVWLIFVGLILLFFTDNELAVYAFPTLAISISIALYNFFSAMQPIRRKIKAAKDAELSLIRAKLAEARARLDRGGDTSDIPALIALEHRIEQVREWPLDLPTAARLPLYLLIPVVPWVGAGFAETILGNMFGGS